MAGRSEALEQAMRTLNEAYDTKKSLKEVKKAMEAVHREYDRLGMIKKGAEQARMKASQTKKFSSLGGKVDNPIDVLGNIYRRSTDETEAMYQKLADALHGAFSTPLGVSQESQKPLKEGLATGLSMLGPDPISVLTGGGGKMISGINKARKVLAPEKAAEALAIAAARKAPGDAEQVLRDLASIKATKLNPEAYITPEEVFKQARNKQQDVWIPKEEGRVVKSPKEGVELNPNVMQNIADDMDRLGLDPNTRTYSTSKRSYQVQDKVKPLDEIPEGDIANYVASMDEELANNIAKLRSKNKLQPFEAKKLVDMEASKKKIALDSPLPSLQDIAHDKIRANTPLSPADIHAGNMGMADDKSIKVFDANMATPLKDSRYYQDTISPRSRSVSQKTMMEHNPLKDMPEAGEMTDEEVRQFLSSPEAVKNLLQKLNK